MKSRLGLLTEDLVLGAIPEKIQTGGGALRTWNFQRYCRKSMWKFQGSIIKEVEFTGAFMKNSRGISMDNMEMVSMGLGFLVLEFPSDVTQFCRISRGESLFSQEFL